MEGIRSAKANSSSWRESHEIGDNDDVVHDRHPVQLGKEKKIPFNILVACIVENSYNSRYKW